MLHLFCYLTAVELWFYSEDCCPSSKEHFSSQVFFLVPPSSVYGDLYTILHISNRFLSICFKFHKLDPRGTMFKICAQGVRGCFMLLYAS